MSKPTGKFKKLKAMDCFDEVHHLLKNGHNAPKVAQLIQEYWEEYKDIQRDSLETILRRYRSEEIPEIDKVAAGEADRLDEALEKLEGQVNVIQELEKLLMFQKKRININYKKEQESGTLLKTTNSEVETAANLVDLIANYQQDYGITPRNLGTLRVEGGAESVGSDYAEGASKAIGDEKSKRKMMQFLEDLSDEGSLEEIMDEDEESEDTQNDAIDAEYEEVEEDKG